VGAREDLGDYRWLSCVAAAPSAVRGLWDRRGAGLYCPPVWVPLRSEGVAANVDLGAADVLRLPFATGSFDAVVCESVLIFVPDKVRAIEECVRVTRPGGYAGINESFWFVRPAPARKK
jgi:SAM-dependent methyltransferase